MRLAKTSHNRGSAPEHVSLNNALDTTVNHIVLEILCIQECLEGQMEGQMDGEIVNKQNI